MPLRSRIERTYGLRLLLEPRVQLLAAVVLLGVVLSFRLFQFLVFSTQLQWGHDFSAYWLAGRNVLEGASVYTPDQLAGPYPSQEQYRYLYPPFLALAVTPLSALFADYRLANWAWAALCAAAGLAAVVGVARAEGFRGRRALVLLVGATLAMPPVVGDLAIGNVNMLLLGLVGAAWVALRRGTPRAEIAAGALVGVATLIKVFPALIVVWFIITGRWRAAGASAFVAGGLALATLPVTGLQPWLDYPIVLANLAPPSDTTHTLAPAVWLGDFIGFTPARLLVGLAGLGVVVWSARSQPAAVSFAVAVVVSLLVAPALYHHYLALAVLPLIVALGQGGLGPGLAVAYLGMFGGEQRALGGLSWVINRGLPTIGILALLGVLLRAGRRRAGGETDLPRAQAAGARAAERAAKTPAPSS